MIFIIDGTGVADHAAYAKEMSGGFCKRLMHKARGRYWRGPTLSGWHTTDIAEYVTEAVMTWKDSSQGQEKLFLAGHSRGGAAAIFVAQTLKKRNVEVEAMFLFDAVDRTVNFRSAQAIPANVRYCYHALRDPSLSTYYTEGTRMARDAVATCVGLPNSMEAMIDSLLAKPPLPGKCQKVIEAARKLVEQDNKMKIVMRSTTLNSPEGKSIDFGNCGLRAEGACKLEKAKFLGSHGAIGGAPIVDALAPALLIDSDRAAMASVDAWMSAHLCRHGVFDSGRIRG
ncbi:hypothetical protein [Massilia sp. LjRoot122]|uniref:hypothetical protein n=1 Tax=Massilia sp. LjRoot122 TaxID=3342257 RepID=UPI003ECF30BA